MNTRLAIKVLVALANTFIFSQATAAVNLVDQANRSVVLPSPATTLVTTYSPANLLLMPLGAADKVVGNGGSTRYSPLLHRFFSKHAPVDIGSRSAGINLETLIALSPDLVIFHGKKDGVRLANKLSAMGVNTMVLQPESLDQVKQALLLLGQALGDEARAILTVAQMDEILSLVSQRLATLSDSEKLSGYYANGEDPLRTAGRAMFQHELMTAAGLNNVAADIEGFYPKVNAEQVYLWSPQFVVAEHSRKSENNKVPGKSSFLDKVPGITLPRDSFWDMPSPMAPAAILLIAAKAYPERFNDMDVNARIAQFYEALLGLQCLSPLEPHPCLEN